MSKLTTEDVLDLIDATGAPANAIVNAFDEASTLLKIIAPQPPKEAILAQAEFMLARRDCDLLCSTVAGEKISPVAMVILKLSGALERSKESA